MANPHRGEVSFDADGKSYTLHFSTNAICELEDKLDRSFVSISNDLAKAVSAPDKIRMTTLRAIFWAGLQDHHPEIDLKAAGKLILSTGGMLGVMNLITEGFARAFPDPETKGARPQSTPPQIVANGDGTGLTS
jgi:hypothetical protein